MNGDTFPLSLCPTGMVPTRADSPYVPITPEEIAEQVLECAELGISSVHIHARHPDGEPAWQRGIFEEIIRLLRADRPDLVVCVTTSGRLEGSLERRSDVLNLEGDLTPDMASLTLSSMNFSASASVNSPETVQALAKLMLEKGIVPELEIFDTGMVNYLHYLQAKGLLHPPFVVNLLLGGVASSQATPLDLGVLVERLPEGTLWSVAGIGRAQLPATAMGLAAGGGVRIGLEDNLHLDSARKRLATNRELVKRVVDIADLLGRAPMAPVAFREAIAR
jgi:3-keto-5-aminohexanoate cleavage enzyme